MRSDLPLALTISCDDCAMARTSTCDDCVVTYLCGDHDRSSRHQLSNTELSTMNLLQRAGLAPRLRLVPMPAV